MVEPASLRYFLVYEIGSDMVVRGVCKKTKRPQGGCKAPTYLHGAIAFRKAMNSLFH